MPGQRLGVVMGKGDGRHRGYPNRLLTRRRLAALSEPSSAKAEVKSAGAFLSFAARTNLALVAPDNACAEGGFRTSAAVAPIPASVVEAAVRQ